MRKLAHRAVIAGASVLTIMSAIGGADLLGQAHADPQCVANAADPCPQADPPQGDPPRAHPPQLSRVCTGGGPKTGGGHCWVVPAPSVHPWQEAPSSMEIEILKRDSALFARDTVLPK
jgi:hypothetical protein